MLVNQKEVASHYFGQSFRSAMREPVEGDTRHEAAVTINHFVQQGAHSQDVAYALQAAGVGSAADLLRDYLKFKNTPDQRPGDP